MVYSMVIHLMAILGPLEGFPWSSRWLSRVWNPAQVPPQWPTVAFLQWPHPPGRTFWQKLIDHLLLFIQCTILQHSGCHSLIPLQFIINRNMAFYMPCSTFLCRSVHLPVWVGTKMHGSAFQWGPASAHCFSVIISWLCHLPTQFRALIGTSRRPTPGLAHLKYFDAQKLKQYNMRLWEVTSPTTVDV